MKSTHLLLLVVISAAMPHLDAADLPTVTVDHLYYLRSRAEHLKKVQAEAMIEYCITQKLGGPGFESLYSQLFSMRVEKTKLLRVDEVSAADPRVLTLNKTYDAYYAVLREEAQKIQSGLLREGQIATDTLEAMARAQSGR